jgi:hypothetical protein
MSRRSVLLPFGSLSLSFSEFTSTSIVTLLRMVFNPPNTFTGYAGWVVDMENQPRTHRVQDELEIQRLSHESGELFESSLAASLNDVPGKGDS